MKKTSMFMLLLFLVFVEACKPSGEGCTDTLANNLDAGATANDGSCTYDEVWINPVRTMALSENLKGISGMLFWDGYLWAHNDHNDTHLYGLDTSNAAILKEYFLEGVGNIDWEDMDQDSEFIYLGDFGNNASGDRKDLHILRISKSSLNSGSPSIDTIWFTYSSQQDLTPVAPNQTEFDCEAMVLSSDHIYLFTKQWLSGHTTLYSLPKEAGRHVAQKLDSFDTHGLVSGACLLESKRVLVLCGYTSLLQPFLYLMYDFPGNEFFKGNKRRVNISLPFHQVEGIASMDGLSYYMSNESYVKEPVNIPQKLHLIELHSFLEEYLDGVK